MSRNTLKTSCVSQKSDRVIRTSISNTPARVTHRRMSISQTAQQFRPPWATNNGYEISLQSRCEKKTDYSKLASQSQRRFCVQTQTTGSDQNRHLGDDLEVERHIIASCNSVPTAAGVRASKCAETQTEQIFTEKNPGKKNNPLITTYQCTPVYLFKVGSTSKWSKDSKRLNTIKNRPPFYPPGPTTTPSNFSLYPFGSMPNFNRLDRIRQTRDLYSRPETRNSMFRNKGERSKSIPNLTKYAATTATPIRPSNHTYTAPSLNSSTNTIDVGRTEGVKLSTSSSRLLSRSMLSMKNVGVSKTTHNRSHERPFWSTLNVTNSPESSINESNLSFRHTGGGLGDRMTKRNVEGKPPVPETAGLSSVRDERRAVSLSHLSLAGTERSYPSVVSRVASQGHLKQLYELQDELQHIIDQADGAVQTRKLVSTTVHHPTRAECASEEMTTQCSKECADSTHYKSASDTDWKSQKVKPREGYHTEKIIRIDNPDNERNGHLTFAPSKHISILNLTREYTVRLVVHSPGSHGYAATVETTGYEQPLNLLKGRIIYDLTYRPLNSQPWWWNREDVSNVRFALDLV